MRKEKIAIYISLIASFLLLLSVIVPHHHHADGMPCYHWLSETTSHIPDTTHDCGCLGHNQALFSSIEQHSVGNQYPILFFLPSIPIPSFENLTLPLPFDSTQIFYIESLHDIWITKASGRRAPPATDYII